MPDVELGGLSTVITHDMRNDIDRRSPKEYPPDDETLISAPRELSNVIVARKHSSMGVIRKNSAASEFLSHSVVEEPVIGFRYEHIGLSTDAATKLLEKHGLNELPEKKIPKWYIYVSQLWQPMPCMIWIAAIIEAAIENWIDMSILVFIQFANASIAYYEITKAGDAVAALKKSLKPQATVKRDGVWKEVNATILVPGDLVLLGSGSAVPADCRINRGTIDVDQAALTGESLPVTMNPGDSCKMGSTVVRGETEGTVEFTGVETFFGKTASLLGVSVPFMFTNVKHCYITLMI